MGPMTLNHTAGNVVWSPSGASKRFSSGQGYAHPGMDQETILQVVVSSVVVLAFIAVLAVLSTTYSVNGGMNQTGGYALVAALLGFVFVLSGAGLWITRRDGGGDTS